MKVVIPIIQVNLNWSSRKIVEIYKGFYIPNFVFFNFIYSFANT